MEELLEDAKRRAVRYLEGLSQRRVAPDAADLAGLERLDGPLPDAGEAPSSVLERLDRHGSPATVASAGGRYFGFVTGGSLPSSLAAQWLAAAWDQNGFSTVSSPVGARLEATAERWLTSLLGLPDGTACGFVTGATMANFTALAAARHAVLAATGWDVERDGLQGAPRIRVVVGEEAHATLFKALGLLGLGREQVLRVPVDGQGALRAGALPSLEAPCILCLQAGNVNTGAFDPFEAACDEAAATGAWVHVDGAFGLWAAAAPGRAHLTAGVARADSWALDAHKWLNVPYDSGLALVRDGAALRAAMAVGAAYLPDTAEREPFHHTPESSRRVRGVEIWAALRSLGRDGLAALVEQNCRMAARLAQGLSAAGHEILNDVALNQVLVRFGDDETTRRVVAAVQADGTCWAGETRWQGRSAMRLSVSSWATTNADVEQSLTAILAVARRCLAAPASP
jgi:glutamate/tyrosine decarboxylase-like PLP-dependent enzyme